MLNQFIILVMRTPILITVFFLALNIAFAQGVAINETSNPAHSSAMLDVSSSDKGILIPRMTMAKRDAIASPQHGLLIYQTDETPGLYFYLVSAATPPEWKMVGFNAGEFTQWKSLGSDIYYDQGNVGIGTNFPSQKLDINGQVRIGGGNPGQGKVLTSDANGNATWQNAVSTYQVGDFAHGGVVFYVEPCGTKGLVCAIEDQNGGFPTKWRGGSTNYNTMAMGDGVYAGNMNTSIIIAVHAAKNDFDNHAALVCANYTYGGFADWYLPSPQELNLMYLNRTAINSTAIANGGSSFASSYYWSSSESGSGNAWGQQFHDGNQHHTNKLNGGYVRAVRAF